MNKKITIMPNRDAKKYYDKLLYFQNLINDLYKNEKYLLPVFLLRCQLVEYSLKYLLINYPFKKDGFIDDKKIEELTLGQTLRELEKIKDTYLDDIIEKVGNLKTLRNDLTHNLIKSEITINEMISDIKEKMKLANEIEENIHYYFNYIDEVYH